MGAGGRVSAWPQAQQEVCSTEVQAAWHNKAQQHAAGQQSDCSNPGPSSVMHFFTACACRDKGADTLLIATACATSQPMETCGAPGDELHHDAATRHLVLCELLPDAFQQLMSQLAAVLVQAPQASAQICQAAQDVEYHRAILTVAVGALQLVRVGEPPKLQDLIQGVVCTSQPLLHRAGHACSQQGQTQSAK